MGLDLCRREGAPPKLVGHRGACDVAPENTLASFERAWRDGADIVELDVRLSVDQHVVVLHDAMLDRTTDGTGYVGDRTLAELRRLDAGAWFDVQYAGERVPTLAEVLDWARDKVGLLLELKYEPFGAFDPALVPRVVAAVVAAGADDRVAAISYQPKGLGQLKGLAPDIPAGPLLPRDGVLRLGVWLAQRFPALDNLGAVRRLLKRPLGYTRRWGCDVVAPNIEMASRVLVQAAHEAGLPVSCGGLEWDYPAAIEMGVDTISANDPGLVRALYL
jgi:glycerophosphoryl diester phosphodiesterase